MRYSLMVLVIGSLYTVPALAACDDEALGKQLTSKWMPKIKASKGMCETADAQIGMLQDVKGIVMQCLVGQARVDGIASVDKKIAEWRHTRSQVCN